MARLVGDDHHVIGHLGGGSTSEVLLARIGARSDKPKLAVIKRLKLGSDADADVVSRFADEARVALRLKHRNIVEALSASQDADGPFLVFEYLDGQTLARIRSRSSRKTGSMPRAIALDIVMSIATALAYAHDAKDETGKPLKIVHRDLTPDNVIVTYDGTTKLLDFSVAIAKIAQVQAGAPGAIGTVAYMAPEQTTPGIAVDARADVFAAGLVLWELLAGRRMWEGLSDQTIITKLADDKPLPSLRSVVPDMPEALDAICKQALAKVRDDRYETARELRDAIEKAQAELRLTTTPAEVGQLVASLFETEREKMRATISEAAQADSSKALPVMSAAPSDPMLGSADDSKPSKAATVVEVLKVEAPPKDRRFAIAVIGGVLIAFSAVAVVALTHKEGPTPTEPTATTRPHPSESTAPSASTWVEPEEVTIEISVTPTNAQLFVDGTKVPGSRYKTKVVRGTYHHEVRAEAENHETRTMKVIFDRDRVIEIALVPTKPPPFGAPPPKPSGTGAPPPKPKPTASGPAEL